MAWSLWVRATCHILSHDDCFSQHLASSVVMRRSQVMVHTVSSRVMCYCSWTNSCLYMPLQSMRSYSFIYPCLMQIQSEHVINCHSMSESSEFSWGSKESVAFIVAWSPLWVLSPEIALVVAQEEHDLHPSLLGSVFCTKIPSMLRQNPGKRMEKNGKNLMTSDSIRPAARTWATFSRVHSEENGSKSKLTS